MNECKGYKIYVNDINTKHLFSVSNKIVFFVSEIGPVCVVNDDICHHVYLDTYTTKAIITAVDKYNSITIQRDFDTLSDFETYLVQNGIYVAYFFWQESGDMTEFNMFYRVRELIPPSGGLVRLRSGGLYNIVAHDYSALFIRNVDSNTIMSYYTDVVEAFIEHYGKLTPRLLMTHKLFNLYATRTMLQYALEASSSEDKNTDLIKSMYDIVDDIIALIELASL